VRELRNKAAALEAVRQDFERTVSLLRATLDATADAILAVDRDGRIETFNAKFVQLWRLPDDVLATRDDDLALAFVLEQLAEPEAFLARVRELYASPDAESLDILRFRDGRIVERSSRPMRGAGGTGGRVWSFRDITAARLNEAERDRLLGEAHEAVRARDDFLSIASHELRTPLTSLHLALQSLRKATREPVSPGAQPEIVETLLATAERQTSTLRRLVEELLSVGRIQAGRLDLDAEDVDLPAVVRDVIGNLEQDIARAGVAVTVDGPDAPLRGRWDRTRIDQVVTNVVTNALRYGGGTRVDIRIARDGARAVLEVSDGGPGIAPELQRRIFERFVRGHPSSHYGGLGLGLYIVHQIVRAHGGDVQVRSEPGQGATFTVTLPVADTTI
jgi:signal transduction histidine kinase